MIMINYNIYPINFSTFSLDRNQFDQQSYLHGIKHTYRVMVHCLRLGVMTKRIKEATVAFFGAYIHDMARLHDGYDTLHGADSAKYKLPLYTTLFAKNGASYEDLKTIRQIVTRHSLPRELPKDDKLYPTLAILKDADALDRIRLGAHDLNPDYLRYEETQNSIIFGEDLYYNTNHLELNTFEQVLQIAQNIENKQK